jgi:methionyl-tRNA formyltransferase
MNKNRLIFFGNERLATGVTTTAPVLRMLISEGYEIAALVLNNAPARSRTKREVEIASVAHAYHIPILFPDKLSDINGELTEYDAIAAVLVAYGKIVPQSVIDIFPKGIINIHPSLLPLHRGPTPIESVILSGENETGVSLMQLAKDMDAGPVFAQEKIQLDGEEAKQELADRLIELGARMIKNNLPSILAGDLNPVQQDSSLATYDSLIQKEDGLMDWSKPAEQLAREVRAYAGWPKSRSIIAGKDVIITKAQSSKLEQAKQKLGAMKISNNSAQIYVQTSKGTLGIECVQPSGKQEMHVSDFLRGNQLF